MLLSELIIGIIILFPEKCVDGRNDTVAESGTVLSHFPMPDREFVGGVARNRCARYGDLARRSACSIRKANAELTVAQDIRERTYRSLSRLCNISWEASSRGAFARARTRTHALTHTVQDRCVSTRRSSTLGVGKMVNVFNVSAVYRTLSRRTLVICRYVEVLNLSSFSSSPSIVRFSTREQNVPFILEILLTFYKEIISCRAIIDVVKTVE